MKYAIVLHVFTARRKKISFGTSGSDPEFQNKKMAKLTNPD